MRPPFPLVTQYASASLIGAITYGGLDRSADPRWRESGAPDLEAYTHWSVRWCGMACLRMVLLARDGWAPTLHELTVAAAAHGAYTDEPGAPRGLVYRPFVQYVGAELALDAEVVTDLDPGRLVAELERGHRVIASVHPEIRRPERESPGRGGHLVLVTGHDAQAGTVDVLDPAGHVPRASRASLELSVLDRFSARRGILLRGV